MNLRQLRGIITKSGKMAFPEHRDLVRQLGADSMVLLKNNGILPMQRGKVALFGAGAVDTLFCGIFYNRVYTDKNVNVKEGLENNGFTLTTGSWLNKMEKAVKQAEKDYSDSKNRVNVVFGGMKMLSPEVPISEADMAEAILGTDTCIYVARRPFIDDAQFLENNKTYQFSPEELDNISRIADSFKNVILVLNSNALEIAAVARMKSIKGIILMGVPGMEAGNSLADVLLGTVNPSGHLTGTWAKKYKDYSTCYNHSATTKAVKENSIDYKEGIYVGYRYFDTFDVAPLYPFGYGLSYTTFDMSLEYFEASWISIMMRVKVTNTGGCSGRSVVQVYCSLPDGKLDKPYQQLCGFGKTGKIKPGESEEVIIKIPMMAITSFDDEKSQFLMEHGDYIFRLGENSRDTKICAKMVLDKTTIIKKVTQFVEKRDFGSYLTPPHRKVEETGYIHVASLSGDDYNSLNRDVNSQDEFTTYITEDSNYLSYVNNNSYDIPFRAYEKIVKVKPCGSATFVDVVKGNVTMEEFVASLSPEILARIVIGSVEESRLVNENRFEFKFINEKKKIDIAAQTTDQFETTLGIPRVRFSDGPSGLRIIGIPTTCFPSPMNMAQTWDMSAMIRMGRAYGREMEAYDIDYCFAPFLNVNRNPMWCRGFEFYSEDPALSGILGAGFIMGVKRYEGRNVIVKNLVTYNQETFSWDVDINLTRRAFAEIYLRPFSACVSVIKPAGFLTSGNRINGKYTSSQRGLITDIVRSDWGINGFVMSDWGSISDKGEDIHAGCDLIMPGYDPDKLLEAMMNVSPTFEPNGYVSIVERAFLYGMPMIKYEKWGSFKLDKNGDSYVTTIVEPGKTVSEKALQLQKEGLCKIKEQVDGSKQITYKGFNRGPYLALGDLQQAAIHLLEEYKNTASMKNLIEKANI